MTFDPDKFEIMPTHASCWMPPVTLYDSEEFLNVSPESTFYNMNTVVRQVHGGFK